jgi:hypothetical protein
MTVGKWSCTVAAVVLACSHAFAGTSDAEQARIAAQIDRLLAGKSAQERADILARVTTQPRKIASTRAKPQKSAADATPVAATVAGKRPADSPTTTSAPSTVFGNCGGLTAVLRRSWTDIDFASCPQNVKDATGALLSYSFDKVLNNTSWTVNGTAAVIYTIPQSVLSTGIYGTLDQVTNSSATQAKKSNIDSNAYGGFLEFVDTNGSYPYRANYFQIRGGGADDNVKKTTNANITAAWIPVYASPTVHIHQPFQPFDGWPGLIRIDPEVLVQYAQVTGSKQTLSFNNKPEALRIGPQVALRFYPGTSELLSHFVASVIYHWAYETYSEHPITWFQANLTYNLDQEGHLGLGGSYQRGRDENTGVFNNLYLVSLTGKL